MAWSSKVSNKALGQTSQPQSARHQNLNSLSCSSSVLKTGRVYEAVISINLNLFFFFSTGLIYRLHFLHRYSQIEVSDNKSSYVHLTRATFSSASHVQG